MEETIHIYHTNDLHSHFENWPRLAAYLQQEKSIHAQTGEDVFLFDCGDFVDRWHPYSEGTLGKGNVELLNAAGYDAVTIGNNEGITLPHHALDELYKEAKFDVIAANLYDWDKSRPPWVLPYKIYTLKSGVRIGITAVTAYYRKLYELLGWDLTEPMTELAMQLNQIKRQTDMIIVLSHLGIYEDEKIAVDFPEVDLILGAHTHHLLPEGKKIGDCMLAAAGKHGEHVGYVQVTFNAETKNVCRMNATVKKVADLPQLPHEASFRQNLLAMGKGELQNGVADIPARLDYSWSDTSPLSALLCEAIHEWCQPDCTLINSGVVLTALDRGIVTKFDLHQMLPHPINPCTVQLTGAELKEVLFHTRKPEWSDKPLKGLGFRGSVMGAFVYEGIQIDQKRRTVHIKGEPLVPEKIYTVGTLDLFTFGPFFPEIQRSPEKLYFMPEFLRDIMAWKLGTMYPI